MGIAFTPRERADNRVTPPDSPLLKFLKLLGCKHDKEVHSHKWKPQAPPDGSDEISLPGGIMLLGSDDLKSLVQIWCTLYPAHAESAVSPVDLTGVAFDVFRELRLKLLNGKNVSNITIDIKTTLPEDLV